MDLDSSRRDQLAGELMRQLSMAVPGSEAVLRGSLAEDRGDIYSDIDLIWDIPDAEFARSLAQLPMILDRVAPVASLRFDPDFQNSSRRRLVFVRFAGVPLFWRVDLDIFSRSVGRDDDFDRHNPAARGSDWSLTESSLANGVAAIKAHLRGRDDVASALLERAEHRIGLHVPAIDIQVRILRLTKAAMAIDPAQASFATEIEHLLAQAIT